MLRRLAAAEPVVVAVDDEQWLDGAVGRRARVRAAAPDRGARADACSPAGRAARRSRCAGIAAALDAARVTRMTADPLELDAVRRLLEARLGTSWSRPALVRIREASGGNPLYALELGRALAARARR